MQTVTIPQAFELALQHHRAARLTEAEAIYRQILAQEANHAHARHHLGIIGKSASTHRHTPTLKPSDSEVHNPGAKLTGQAHLEEAIAACHKALQIKPDYAEAHNNLGNALRDQGRLDEAISAYRTAAQ